MRKYYSEVWERARGLIFDFWDATAMIILLAVSVLILLNRDIGQSFWARYQGVDPQWSALVLVLAVCLILVRSNHLVAKDKVSTIETFYREFSSGLSIDFDEFGFFTIHSSSNETVHVTLCQEILGIWSDTEGNEDDIKKALQDEDSERWQKVVISNIRGKNRRQFHMAPGRNRLLPGSLTHGAIHDGLRWAVIGTLLEFEGLRSRGRGGVVFIHSLSRAPHGPPPCNKWFEMDSFEVAPGALDLAKT